MKAASARVDAMEEIPGATAIPQGVDDGDVAVDASAGAAATGTAAAVTAPTATALTATASAASASVATATTVTATATTPRGNTPVIRPPTLTCLACARSIPIAEVRALVARSPTHASMEEHALLPYDVDDMYFYNPRSGVPCCETCSHAAAGSAAPGKELVGSGCGPILRMQLTWYIQVGVQMWNAHTIRH